MPEALPSQYITSIDEIRDGVIILKSGGLRRVLIISGLNFELKSEDERNAVIASFQQMLIGLDFSIEFVVHSRRVDIRKYVDYIRKMTLNETHEILKIQAEEYIKFVQAFVELYSIMEKKFFAVIPYDPVYIKPQAIKSRIAEAVKKRPPGTAAIHYSFEEYEQYRNQLDIRVEEISMELSRLGVKAIPLGTEELIELFHHIYNPAAREKHLSAEASHEISV